MRGWWAEVPLLASGVWPGSLQRFGVGTLQVQPGSVWIHGASLGEVRTARALAALLQPAFVTTDTQAGRVHAHGYRPLDHPWTLAPLFAEARPRLVVMVESSWWPALASMAAKAGVPVIGVGVRATASTLRRFRLLGGPVAVFAQTPDDVEPLARHTEVLGVSGTLKAARLGPSPIQWEAPFLVAASAHPGDGAALLRARDQRFASHSVLIAPRHAWAPPPTDRPLLRRSDGACSVPAGSDLWLDSFGELDRCLQGADAVFIGGSFDARVGGHSPIEARAAGVPIVHGPEIQNNRCDFVGTHLAASPGALADALERAITCPIPPLPAPVPSAIIDAMQSQMQVGTEICPRPWLRPFQGVQRRLVRRPRRALSAWVIAVGSRNARGAGKTSTAAFVAEGLRARGIRYSILTRGHGRRARGVGDSKLHGPDPWWLGDEGAALALAGHRVIAHPDRARAARSASDQVLVLEDGLYAGVRADRTVEAVDVRFPTGRGVQPAGEARTDQGRADLEVFHHVGPWFPEPAGGLVAVRRPGPWSRTPGEHVAFSGIARPVDFFDTLPDAHGFRGFPDHGWHTTQRMCDLHSWAAGRDLVTTDRDWVRIAPTHRAGVCWRGVRVQVEGFPWSKVLP